MKDALSEIYQVLMADDFIKQAVANGAKHSIYYYEMPDGTLPKNLIIIRPYSPPEPAYGGSDKYLAQRLIFQIDVQATDRMTCKRLQREIEQQLLEIDYKRLPNQELDEYFKDTKHFVDARRYQKITRIYDANY